MVTTTSNVGKIGAVVTYVNGASDVTYTNIETDIFLNYSTKNKVLADSIASVDVTALSVTKSSTDSAIMLDTLSVGATKAFADSITINDAIVVSRGFGRSFSDVVSIHDSQTNIYEDGPLFNEFVLNAGPLLADARTYSNASITLNKNTAEALVVSEEATYTYAVGRGLANAASISDVSAATLVKNLADSISLSDDFAIHETRNHSLVNSTVVLDAATITFMSGFTLNSPTMNSISLN